MLVDGAEPDILRTAIDLEITAYENQKKASSQNLAKPPVDMPRRLVLIGAVLGLIHVMENFK